MTFTHFSTIIATTCTIALAIGTPGLAAGLDYEPEPTLRVASTGTEFQWTGFYVSGGIGMGSSNYELGLSYSASASSTPSSLDFPDLGGEGMIGSIRAGYDHQVNEKFILGAHIDAAFSQIINDTNLSLSADLIGSEFDFGYDLSPSTIYTLAGRAGYLANETTMLYGLLGYSQGNFEGVLSGSFMGGESQEESETLSYTFERDGVTVGFGMETILAANLSLGIEYRYTRFDRYSFYDGGLTDDEDNIEIGFDTSVQSVQGLLSYRF